MKTQASKQEKKVDLRPVVVVEKMEFESGLVTYKVPSNSQEGEFHYVTFDGDEIVSCTCLGFRNYGHCYVSKELKEREHTPEASQEELPIETSQKGALHSSRPFSLMR